MKAEKLKKMIEEQLKVEGYTSMALLNRSDLNRRYVTNIREVYRVEVISDNLLAISAPSGVSLIDSSMVVGIKIYASIVKNIYEDNNQQKLDTNR